jgi:hypothetical protein
MTTRAVPPGYVRASVADERRMARIADAQGRAIDALAAASGWPRKAAAEIWWTLTTAERARWLKRARAGR